MSRFFSKPCTRRAFLRASSAAAVASVIPLTLMCHKPEENELSGLSSLRQAAADKGIEFGAAVEAVHLKDPDLYDAFVNECGLCVPEWSMKWASVRPDASRWSWDEADALVSFAENHAIKVRGHTLVWYAALPDWAKEKILTGQAERLMDEHIQQMMTHFQGRICSWDVVNEALEPQDNLEGCLRASPWLTALGPRYLDKAFFLAAQYDPMAQRVYNDYAVESNPVKANALIALLRGLKERGVPIDAVGLQAHLSVTRAFEPLQALCKAIKEMDLDLLITEMDVEDLSPFEGNAEQDRRVADTAKAFLDIVFSVMKPKQILTWGLSDRHTWLADPKWNGRNPLGLPVRPLPLDRACLRKPLWNILYEQFEAL